MRNFESELEILNSKFENEKNELIHSFKIDKINQKIAKEQEILNNNLKFKIEGFAKERDTKLKQYQSWIDSENERYNEKLKYDMFIPNNILTHTESLKYIADMTCINGKPLYYIEGGLLYHRNPTNRPNKFHIAPSVPMYHNRGYKSEYRVCIHDMIDFIKEYRK